MILYFLLLTSHRKKKKVILKKNKKQNSKSMDSKAKTRQDYRCCKKPFYPLFYINFTGTDTDVKKRQASFQYNQFLWISTHTELEECYSTHKLNFPILKTKTINPANAELQIQFPGPSWEDDLIIRERTLVRRPHGKGHFLQNLICFRDS